MNISAIATAPVLAVSAIHVATTIVKPAADTFVQTQPAIRDFVLYGDSGLLIQSNNAAATLGRLIFQPIYPTRVTPPVPPIDPISETNLGNVLREARTSKFV